MLAIIFKNLSIRERKIFWIVGIIFALAALLKITLLFYSNTELRPVHGGILREGVVGQPVFINPLLAVSDIDLDLTHLIFSPLSQFINTIKMNDEGTIWELDLKDNIMWDDKMPIDSDDVLFTISAIQDPSYHVPLALYSSWQNVSVERISARKIRFTLKLPYAFFEDTIKNLRIVPRHIFENIPPENIRFSERNLKPVGNGPFAFSQIQKLSNGLVREYDLRSNEYFVGAKPFLEGVKFSFFIAESEVINAFNHRTIDALLISNPSLSDIILSHNIFIYRFPQYYALFLSQLLQTDLKDDTIRQALNLLVDKQKIVRDVFQMQAQVVDGPIAEPILGDDNISIARSSFDPAAANALLEKNGWHLDADGHRFIMENKNKRLLSFEIAVPDDDLLIATAQTVKTAWEAAGIRTDIRILNHTELLQTIKTRNYQILLFGQILNRAEDLYSFWHSSQRYDPGLNLAVYSNPAVDTLLENLKQELDPIKRNDLLHSIDSKIKDDVPAIFLVSQEYRYVVSRLIGGIRDGFLSMPSERFDAIGSWYMSQARFFR